MLPRDLRAAGRRIRETLGHLQQDVRPESLSHDNVRLESLTYDNIRLESLTYDNVRLESLTYGRCNPLDSLASIIGKQNGLAVTA